MKIAGMVLLGLLPVLAAAEGEAPWAGAMTAADTDGDGRVSMQEVTDFSRSAEYHGFQPFMVDHFMDLDTDHDDMISTGELTTGIMKLGMDDDEVARGFKDGFGFMPKE
jgi:Ca2+-binding EF-hand superfamily protein